MELKGEDGSSLGYEQDWGIHTMELKEIAGANLPLAHNCTGIHTMELKDDSGTEGF